MDESNSLPVPVEEELVERDPSDPEGHRWAKPSVKGLRSLMRFCVENRDEAARLGAEGRRTMMRDYSPERVLEVVEARLARVRP